jgi:hypothetical protein
LLATGHPQAAPPARAGTEQPGRVGGVRTHPEVPVSHPDDRSRTVQVQPPLEPVELELLAGLACAGRAVRSLWPGQPGPRSPWVPCARGCCLVAEERAGADPVIWMRFLVKEVLAPQAREARALAERVGLPGGHRLDGRVLLSEGRRLLAVSGRQVRVTSPKGGGGTDRSRDN